MMARSDQWEIIAKGHGGGRTIEAKLGPYGGEPPAPMLRAVHNCIAQRFEEFTGYQHETLVVTSTKIVTLPT